ncbi:M20 family metallopeptidase [Nocardia sp. XZ_19_369]|uniref:M20 family metallopeptidase n=1 Tax=Nocardia sp. XZ_19_369 TaxID=2769487 RepID=UPI00188FEEE9|nr:M20/M25/M40 family metallo-hydrolase [Nocardia sp. XZ_19_369]
MNPHQPRGRRRTITPEDVRAAAKHDHDSVLALTRALVAIPSRGGIDPYIPILEAVSDWLHEHGLEALPVRDARGLALGLACEIRGGRPGPRWVLNACLDTAGFDNLTAWTYPPTDPVIDDGWLYGRGSSDSKSGAAIFCHLAARLNQIRDQLAGRLVLLFDVDEHTGQFGGARAYFEHPEIRDDVAGVMIGYPGHSKIVIGGRGVHRVRLHVHGVTSHAGGSTSTPNAIDKATELIALLRTAELPAPADPAFPLPAKLTITAITGGEGYSLTPGICYVNVDIRTTPDVDNTAAAQLLRRAVATVDNAWPATAPTYTEEVTQWSPFRLDRNAPLAAALFDAAESLGVSVTPKIAGPSNIANFLAGLGIPATAGFGVSYEAMHGIDERIRIDTLPTVQAVYHAAVLNLLCAPS